MISSSEKLLVGPLFEPQTRGLNQDIFPDDELSQILEMAGTAAIQVDLKTGIGSRSKSHDKLLGYSQNMEDWSKEKCLKHIHPEDLSYVLSVEGEEDHNSKDFKTIEFRVIWPDKSIHWIHFRFKKIYDERAFPVRLIAILADVTERKALEMQLKEKNEKLLSLNRQLERFASTAAHDLKAPLRQIALQAQLLEKYTLEKSDTKCLESLKSILGSSKRMSKLIANLLDYARFDSSIAQISLVSLREAAETAIKNIESMIETENASVVLDITHSLVPADFTYLIQIFQNLASNALKFRSEQPLAIRIHSKELARHWIVCVEDNGLGIDPAYFEKIFKSFERLHSEKDYEGSGLGLSICQSAVERMGGQIWVESELGKGARFFFTIPKQAPK